MHFIISLLGKQKRGDVFKCRLIFSLFSWAWFGLEKSMFTSCASWVEKSHLTLLNAWLHVTNLLLDCCWFYTLDPLWLRSTKKAWSETEEVLCHFFSHTCFGWLSQWMNSKVLFLIISIFWCKKYRLTYRHEKCKAFWQPKLRIYWNLNMALSSLTRTKKIPGEVFTLF